MAKPQASKLTRTSDRNKHYALIELRRSAGGNQRPHRNENKRSRQDATREAIKDQW